ncbi:MAG: AAA family ATPase [Candidatus Aenigmatarchaeota archaeon]
MIVKRVGMKNWRSHLDSSLEFYSGTNALLGRLGSGKTSVLDAICFAFFGTFPNLQVKKLKLDDVIMKRPIEKNMAEVNVEFEVDGKEYFIKRVIERGKGTTYSEIRENGRLIEAPSSQNVTRILEKIIKVDYDLFSKAIYSEQNALDYFLTIQRGQRMKKLDELLAIDKFEKAKSTLVTVINKIFERKTTIQSIIDESEIENINKNISDLKVSLKKISEEKEETEKRFKEIKEKAEKIDKEVSELEEIEKSLNSFKREEAGIKSAIEEISGFLQSIQKLVEGKTKAELDKRLEDLKNMINQIDEKIRKRKDDYERLSNFFSETRTKLEILKKEKIEMLKKEVEKKIKIKKEMDDIIKEVGEDFDTKKEEKRKALEKISTEVEIINSKLFELNELISKLLKVEGRCPVCDSELSFEKRELLIKERQKQIEDLKKRLEESEKKKVLSEKEFKEFEEIVKKLNEMHLEIRDLNEKTIELEESKIAFKDLSKLASEAESNLIHMKKEIENLESKIREGNEEKQSIEDLILKLEEYEKKSSRLIEFKKKEREIEEKILEINKKIFGKNLEEMKKNLIELNTEKGRLESNISAFEKLKKEKEEIIKKFEERLKIFEKQKEEVKGLEKLISELKVFEKALESTQVQLRDEFVEGVNYMMNELWETLYPYQDFVGVRLNIEGGDYVLQLQSRTAEWVNVEGVASGGERSIACLALRIALSLVLAPHLKILVLDEPTHNLDEKSVESLIKTLKERTPQFIDQLFIISHDQKIQDAITGCAYLLEREKRLDEPTKVIKL